MVRLLLALSISLAATAGALAEQVAVQSGEHGDFTRLVLDFDAPVGWQMTRSEDGYQLVLDRPGMRFDLSDVFRLIPRTRLSSIWADPATGALMLGIGCACHAFPFELRPDILVIDLRDGPAPPGSAFELGTDGQVMPPLAASSSARPKGRPPASEGNGNQGVAGYDWLDQLGTLLPAASIPSLAGALPVTPENTALAPAAPTQTRDHLRDELLRQISNGAARGMVDLAERRKGGKSDGPVPTAQDGLAQVRIGGEVGIDPAAGDRPDNALTAEGTRCLPDEAVDLGAWGDTASVADAIGPRTGGLFTEFDKVDQARAETAVRYLLHLGFGAEARGLIRILGLDGPDVALWSALSAVVDGDLTDAPVLAGMEICDSAVALWAVLARSDLKPGETVQTGAILRAFSALPLHLRRHLGPILADRFMARGDAGVVRAIRDTILRPGGDPGPEVRLMDAELQAASGHGAQTDTLVALQSAPGRTAAAATVAAILAIVAEGGTVDMGMLTATEALLREYKGAEEEAGLRHALALAQATQGAFAAAFDLLPADDIGRADLWRLLAERGAEADLLTHALPGGAEAARDLDTGIRNRMARRLIDAGFPDSALDWLNAAAVTGNPADEGHLLLAAEAELQRRDARAAIGLLASVEGPEAAALRNQALLQLGTPEPLQRVQTDASASESQRQQAARMALAWPDVAQGGEDVWARAAGVVTKPPPPEELPPLARARALLDESTDARQALQDLMEATAAPAVPPPAEGGT